MLSLEINLIGVPEVTQVGAEPYRPRSRKTWALLCYLVLSERPPSRSRLSSLLFGEADDPLRALRWSLTEVRRLLGLEAHLSGDPLVMVLPEDVDVDVDVIKDGRWESAIALPGVGDELLAGFDGLGSPEFESWLLSHRRHIAVATEDVVHEATLALLARGEYDRAIPLAVTLVGLDPYRETHQALLIRAYTNSGDSDAARRQLQACTELFASDLGVAPGPAVRAAALSHTVASPLGVDVATVQASIEAGMAALSAGATDAGLLSLRSAVVMADSLEDAHLPITSRLALADAVFFSVQGDNEEAAVILHEVAEMAQKAGEDDLVARARVELGYLDMLGARYHRAQQWLDLSNLDVTDPGITARTHSYLGCLQSDRADYPKAEELLKAAIGHAQAADDLRQEAYAVSLLGRVNLLRGDLDSAARLLSRSITLAETENWLAFVPWPQALLGEVEFERGDQESARQTLEQAFARACQIGDPCWEGVSGRGLALVAEARGETKRAFHILQDASERCDRRSDTYVWAKAYILETQCSFGLIHGHQDTSSWIAALFDLVAGTGMRELEVKAMVHRTAAGTEVANHAAVNLAEEIENPRLLAMTTSL